MGEVFKAGLSGQFGAVEAAKLSKSLALSRNDPALLD
jgi:hypothetical protein